MNKIIKNIVIGLVVISVFAAMACSGFIWHQPKTPDCIA